MTPYELDIIANGVKVYIWRSPSDRKPHATLQNIGRFTHEDPLEIVRIPVESIPHGWKCEEDPRVIKAMKKWDAA